MTTVSEASGAKPQLAAGLAEGINVLSSTQTVVFTLYAKIILPIDGYVYWVNASLLTEGAIATAAKYSGVTYKSLPPVTLNAQGSLHHSTDLSQEEDRTTAVNHLIFSSLGPVQNFNLINPNLMYVADYNGMKFAFSRRDNFYVQADMYHYRGDALYSSMSTQLIDSLEGFDLQNVVVSNSLPFWLQLNQFFPIYPSFLVPQGTVPPYAVAHIDPDSTQAMQAAPLIDITGSHNQCVTEKVKITILGIRNETALAFQDYVNNYSLGGNFGISNMPVMQDEKLPQTEFGIIAMKKVINYDINYFQQNVVEVAQQLITSAFISISTT